MGRSDWTSIGRNDSRRSPASDWDQQYGIVLCSVWSRITKGAFQVADPDKQKELQIQDEEEDYLDEASIHAYGSKCPMPLRLIACVLLQEITTFLRETYQNLPKSSKIGGVMWWSTLLFGQQLIELQERRDHLLGRNITVKKLTVDGAWHCHPWDILKHPLKVYRALRVIEILVSLSPLFIFVFLIESHILDQAERKISFVLHEPDESEGSSNTTMTMQVIVFI